jgi:hypothetical protein
MLLTACLSNITINSTNACYEKWSKAKMLFASQLCFLFLAPRILVYINLLLNTLFVTDVEVDVSSHIGSLHVKSKFSLWNLVKCTVDQYLRSLLTDSKDHSLENTMLV